MMKEYMEAREGVIQIQEQSVETELAYRKKGTGEWKSLYFQGTDELLIDNDDLEKGVEYEARVRNRFLREGGTPLTQWGPWSPTVDFMAE